MTKISPEEEFIERFVAHMLRRAGPKFDDGSSVAEYARDVAPSYWDDPDPSAEGPPGCPAPALDCRGER